MKIKSNEITNISSILTLLLSIVLTSYLIIICFPWDETVDNIGAILYSVMMKSSICAISIVMLILNCITVHYSRPSIQDDTFNEY